jgi:hypothetical protein
MAGHTPITPEEVTAAAEVYRATGNYAEAARAIGRDKSSTRRALIAAAEPLRATLHTQALARAERDALRALVKVRKGLVDDFAVAAEPKDRAALSAQVHDNARATTQMRVAHAKLTGDHAPDKHAHTVEADDALASKLARLAAAAATGEDPR